MSTAWFRHVRLTSSVLISSLSLLFRAFGSIIDHPGNFNGYVRRQTPWFRITFLRLRTRWSTLDSFFLGHREKRNFRKREEEMNKNIWLQKESLSPRHAPVWNVCSTSKSFLKCLCWKLHCRKIKHQFSININRVYHYSFLLHTAFSERCHHIYDNIFWKISELVCH